MSFRNKTVLVTGGAGFIGSHLADKLLKKDPEKLVILDNLCAGSKNNISHLENNEKFEFVNGNVTDYELVKKLVENTDYIFHEAASKMVVAYKVPRTDLETNIIGTFNILEAIRNINPEARLVHASTGSVLGSSDKPMKEDNPKNPTSLYGISKLAGENYVIHYAKELDINASVIRYFHVFGPRQDYSGEAGVVSIFLSKILNGKSPTVFGSGEQIRCFTNVSDDVNATIMLAEKKEALGEAYNVASKTRISVKELAEKIIYEYSDKPIKIEFGPARKGENIRPIPDTNKIEKLGFEEKMSFDEGLELTKKWVEKNQ